MTTRAPWIALSIAFLLPAATAGAQREGYSYLSYVGSEVSLVSRAEDDSSARLNTPILAGDRMATGSTSRAEAILADGSILRIDVQTSLRFDRLAKTYEAADDLNALYLERGAISLEHRGSTSRDQATRIDTDDVTVVFPEEGLLRVETGRRGTEVYVASGQAEVYARSGRATLRAGQYAFASGDATLEIDWMDEPRDRFTRFVGERRNLAAQGSSSPYVSAEYGYDSAVADFDQHGTWILVNGSTVWRPSVAVDWRPYVDGYWRWSPAGLTWVAYEPWGWLPYHYGSWEWDAGVGWYWRPGAYYSPAWVYWSYTPSWIGWCPIGYYGGYYGDYGGGCGGDCGGGHPDPYARSHRKGSGAERGTLAYPHLRGRVDVTRVDPRGWSYASVTRLGTRFESRRDVLGHERVGFRAGERGIVATSPLRIERGQDGSATTAVQDAVRRVPRTIGTETRGGRSLEDITPVLRREGTLGASTQEALRRSFVTAGQDPGYRPVPADQIAEPRRELPYGTTAGNPSREGARGGGSTSTPARGGEGAAPSRGADSTPRETWRDGGAGAETRPWRTTNLAPRRDAEAPLSGGFGRDRSVKSDDGWRSPGGEPRSGTTPSRSFDVPARRSAPAPESPGTPQRTGTREAVPEPEPWRSTTETPARRDGQAQPEAGSSSPSRREAPGLRGDEGWRGSDTPSRSGDAPRPAPAPRSEAPARSDIAPPSRSYEAPRPAPAPRSEAPARSSIAPPSRSYEAPPPAPAPRS
ncbi:MAG TPA: DUF6600 domain-containing protein, partial [Thermoanaerobaculia bacterium]|nr:DUF6600 domain-containing protein [Thermoanaerobaculia bacterium]